MQQMQGYGWGPPPQLAQPTGGFRRFAIIGAAVLVAVWFIASNLGPRGLLVAGLGWWLWSLFAARRAAGQGRRAVVEYAVVVALLLLTVIPLPTVRKPAFLEDPPSVQTSQQEIKQSVGDFWQRIFTAGDRQPERRGGGR